LISSLLSKNSRIRIKISSNSRHSKTRVSSLESIRFSMCPENIARLGWSTVSVLTKDS
jgi:hypothetical protein